MPVLPDRQVQNDPSSVKPTEFPHGLLPSFYIIPLKPFIEAGDYEQQLEQVFPSWRWVTPWMGGCSVCVSRCPQGWGQGNGTPSVCDMYIYLYIKP